MANKNLLLEIGVEDLPSKNLKSFLEKVKNNIEFHLDKNSINFSECKFYFTNIRLIFVIKDINDEIIHEKKLIKGPPLQKCFDEKNNLSKTGEGFAKKYNIDFKDLNTKKINGEDYVFFEKPELLIKTKNILPKILEKALIGVEEQKKMKWGYADVFFIRPIRWMLLLFGDELIKSEILGIKIDNFSYGHRWLSNKKIKIKNQKHFFDFLQNENILYDNEKRKDFIYESVKKIISEEECDEKIDEELLEELSAMTETPHFYLGSFPEKYLELPKEVLEYVIQDTQKHFLLYQNGKVTNKFIGLSNLEINQNILNGNEMVIKPRLDDALFFISKDLSNNIFNKHDDLKKVIFHKKLGSLDDKVKRLLILSDHINSQCFYSEGKNYKDLVKICKLDLISSMVVEIPKLQGHIGSYYASESGFDKNIANGIKEHYLPIKTNDPIPKNVDSQIVSIADKLDTVVGIFLANEKPSGTRDPLGIRRSTNGILKILLNGEIYVDLQNLIEKSSSLFLKNKKNLTDKKESVNDCKNFFKEKLFSILKDDFRFNDSVIQSVLWYSRTIDPYTMLKKVSSVDNVLGSNNFTDLFSNAKRVSNILKKSNGDFSSNIQEKLLRESSEKILYNEINGIQGQLDLYLTARNYGDYLNQLNILNKYIANFFDEVIVNADEEDIKINRLSLLARIDNIYNKIGNIATLNP